jgi:putative membrane protein
MMLRRLGFQFARGFAMGASDVVPGVSGGTIALILGIYNDLIANIGIGAKALGSLLRADWRTAFDRLRTVDWAFLMPLLAGIATAIVVLAGLIEQGLHDHPESMAGLFFGLVVGSIAVAWRLVRQPTRVDLLVVLAVGVATFVLLGFQSGPVADPSPFALIGAGALAICAMILPGISGSFILLMIGMYAAVLSAVDDRELLDIAFVGIGAVIGLAVFSSLLNHLLARYHDLVMATLIGLMVGSLRVLWPWPNGVGIIERDAEETISGTGLGMPDGAPWVLPVVLAAVAAGIVYAVASAVRAEETALPETVVT